MRSIVDGFPTSHKDKNTTACSYHLRKTATSMTITCLFGGCPINPTNQPPGLTLTWKKNMKKTSTNPMNILQLLHFNTNLKVPTIYRYTSILRMSLPSLENTHHPFPSTPRQHAKEILDVKDQVPRFQEELRCPVQLQWIEACGPLIFDLVSNDGLNMIRW